MNKFIDRLFASSKDLLSHFSIATEERDAAWEDELRTHKVVFEQYYETYTMGLTKYIDIDAVSAKTKSSANEVLWHRMTQAVAIANLAHLLSDVESQDHRYVLDRLPTLKEIDDHYPVAFIPGGRDGLESYSWLLSVEQAFAVRVQRFIETLRGQPENNPSRVFANVFLAFDTDNMTDDMLEQQIDEPVYKPYMGIDIEAEADDAQQYRDRMTGFRDMLDKMQPSAVIERLGGDDGDYRFDSFLTGFKNWIRTAETRLSGPNQSQAPLVYDMDSHYSADLQLQNEASGSRSVLSL